ncbi:hypothetical protein ACJIZ3_012172 [Penstemon smallii]|uniref:Uncharacterized protein n=1 Tax=Penstemon smallii TaxID=265156 RepID=A0ABD3UMJ8_9LAMI
MMYFLRTYTIKPENHLVLLEPEFIQPNPCVNISLKQLNKNCIFNLCIKQSRGQRYLFWRTNISPSCKFLVKSLHVVSTKPTSRQRKAVLMLVDECEED